ncbi:soluble methane monooxygenase reductase component [Methylocaldum marinum]|uniref:Soluble methane monooxygenase reductase component n=1 Tax=Methylocaldum marinum TaxID=1432792 RepID=A0A250KSH3_9GAMM|nr:2Fe-2S iron-sulfur cluster binding domain-containing protein [Methylocaldum marinum]BBA32729.1 soluble methane monooxygenase reductase component [Methylocaldum marinum]
MSKVHRIRAVTEDGHEIAFECRSDENVISAGLRQDVILMASCREGGCATCKAYCAEGDYQLVGTSVQALPPDEEEEGLVLLCRCFPESDLELELPYTYDRISFAAENPEFQAEVVDFGLISCNVMCLNLRRIGQNSDRKVRFSPGQFFDIRIPGAETNPTRSYSPANIANDEGELELLIRLLPDGRFSEYLRNHITKGERLTLRGPGGIFGLKENGFRPRYFVAGGTGLAPVLSMVRHMHAYGEPQESHIYFGVNTAAEVFCIDTLKALESAMNNLTVHICVWQPDHAWDGERGSVIDIVRRDLRELRAKPDIYLCGPPGMVDAAHAACDEFGIPKNQIYMEKFLPSGPCGEACDPTVVHVHHSAG